MTPLKNGAVINLMSHECSLRCDAYQLKGWGWLFRVNNQRMPISDDPDFEIAGYSDWFDEGALHGTILVSDRNVRVLQKFRTYMGWDL